MKIRIRKNEFGAEKPYEALKQNEDGVFFGNGRKYSGIRAVYNFLRSRGLDSETIKNLCIYGSHDGIILDKIVRSEILSYLASAEEQKRKWCGSRMYANGLEARTQEI